MKIKKPSIPFLKAFPIVYLGFLSCAFVITSIFVYRNIYLTIAQVESVEALERTVSRERLNRPLWDKVITSRFAKLTDGEDDRSPATSTPQFIRDPFQPL